MTVSVGAPNAGAGRQFSKGARQLPLAPVSRSIMFGSNENDG